MASPLMTMDSTDARAMAELVREVFNIADHEAINLVAQVRTREPLEVIVSVALHTAAQPRGWHAGATKWELRYLPAGTYQLCLMERDVRSKRQQERNAARA